MHFAPFVEEKEQRGESEAESLTDLASSFACIVIRVFSVGSAEVIIHGREKFHFLSGILHCYKARTVNLMMMLFGSVRSVGGRLHIHIIHNAHQLNGGDRQPVVGRWWI